MATITKQIIENSPKNPEENKDFEELQDAKPIPRSKKELRATTLPDLPCIKGKQVSTEKGLQWLNRVSDDAKDRIKLYLYRVYPVIRREPAYIQKIEGLEKFSENSIVANHGGGTYQIRVQDLGDDHTLFHFLYEVAMVTYPPILDYKELDLNNNNNRTFIAELKQKGIIKLSKEGLIEILDSPEKEEKYQMQPPVTDVMAEISKIWEKANNKPSVPPEITALLTQIANKKEVNPMDTLTPILVAFAPILGKLIEPKPQDNTMVTLLMEQAKLAREEAKEAREQNRLLLDKMFSQKQPDPIDQLMKVLDFKNTIQTELNASNQEAPKDKVDRLIDAFGSIAPPLISKFLLPQGIPQQQQIVQPQISSPQTNGASVASPIPPVLVQQFNDSSFSTILSEKINVFADSSKIELIRKEEIEHPGWDLGQMLYNATGSMQFIDVIRRIPVVNIVQLVRQTQVGQKLNPVIKDEHIQEVIEEFIMFKPEVN